MVSEKGIFLDSDGKYKDIGDQEELTVQELNHSIYGVIKYISYDYGSGAMNQIVSVENQENGIPSDWEDEL